MDEQDIYESLREQALTVIADELGLAKRANDPFGVLMETGYPNGTATLVAFGEGSASLYFSSGGGIIGGGRHASVREAALDFVDLSRQFLEHMDPAAIHPLPSAGKVAFTVLTPSGAWSTTEDEQDLGHNRSELAPLFYAGHAVITELRLIAESSPAASPSPRSDNGTTED